MSTLSFLMILMKLLWLSPVGSAYRIQIMFARLTKKIITFAPLLCYSLFDESRLICSHKRYESQLLRHMHDATLVSNNPCEDCWATDILENDRGYMAAVFDGHGGWQAEHCRRTLLQNIKDKIAKYIKRNGDEEEQIANALKQAFLQTEFEFRKVAKDAYRLGFGQLARVGSCALVCLVYKGNLYTANVGDSLAILVSEENGVTQFLELNRELNANLPAEQERLKSQFPSEKDIVVCKRGNTSCYVKGRLQPTRAIGDLRMKFKDYNNLEEYSKEHGFASPIPNFTGPYISALPEVTVHKITRADKFVVLGTDGLWEKLSRKEVIDAISKPYSQLPSRLLGLCVKKVASEKNMTVEEVMAIPQGNKRKLHDDITVMVMEMPTKL